MTAGIYGVYLFLFLALYFEVFLLISFFEKKPARKSAERPLGYPTAAIIVPCWNEEATLAGTIESLLALDYPADKLSILIVNDGSTDLTLDVANRYASNPQVRVFSKPNGGKYTALNYGIARTDAEFVGCLDADSFVVPDALIEAMKKFEERPDAMAVVPAMKVWHPRRPLELMQAVEYTFGIFYKKMFDNLAAISVLPGPFSIYRRRVFDIAGPFKHAHQTEDMEMAFRMHDRKLPIVNAHTAIVYTKVPPTLRKLLRQRTRWSRGFLENSRDYKHMYFNPGYGYFGMLVLPFSLTMFFGALYMFVYLIAKMALAALRKFATWWATNIPLMGTWRLFHPHFDWFYVNTSVLSFLIVVTAAMTLTAILIGRRIAGANFGIGSIVAYFILYGFVAPLWLARATWGTIVAKNSTWR